MELKQSILLFIIKAKETSNLNKIAGNLINGISAKSFDQKMREYLNLMDKKNENVSPNFWISENELNECSSKNQVKSVSKFVHGSYRLFIKFNQKIEDKFEGNIQRFTLHETKDISINNKNGNDLINIHYIKYYEHVEVATFIEFDDIKKDIALITAS